jgi:hypothetical protein
MLLNNQTTRWSQQESSQRISLHFVSLQRNNNTLILLDETHCSRYQEQWQVVAHAHQLPYTFV